MKTSFRVIFAREASRPKGVTFIDDANHISGAIGCAPVYFGTAGQDILFHLWDKESLESCFTSGTLQKLKKLGFTPKKAAPAPERVKATLRVGRAILGSLGDGKRILDELRGKNEGIEFIDAFHFPNSDFLKITLASSSDSKKILEGGVRVSFIYVPPANIKILKTITIRQCLKCYSLGHNTRNCPTPRITRCSKCGSEGHRYGACGAGWNKCFLCGGRHSAISDACPMRQRAAETAGTAFHKPLPTESYPQIQRTQIHTQPLPSNPTTNLPTSPKPTPNTSDASSPTPNTSDASNPTPSTSSTPIPAPNLPHTPNPTPNPPRTKKRARSPAVAKDSDHHTSMGDGTKSRTKKPRQEDPALTGVNVNAGLLASTIGVALERESATVADKPQCPSGSSECTGLQKSQVLALSIVYTALLMAKSRKQVQELLSSALKDLGLPTFQIPAHILDSLSIGPNNPSFPHPAPALSTGVKAVPSSTVSQLRESKPKFRVLSARANSHESTRRLGGLMQRVPVPRACSTGRPKLNLTTLNKETLKAVSLYPKPAPAVQTHPAHQAN